MKLKTKYSIVLLAAFVITAVLSAMLASLLKAPGTAKIVIDQQAFFFFALGIGAIVIILLALMAQYWLDQLNDIANALYDCSKGKLTTLPIKSDDELGDVCRAFNEASANIGRGNVYQTSRSKVLQAKIDKKTQDQTRQLKELEAMRAATLNMLEDLDQAYGDLKEEVREKDELFNITSHELKSPLVPIVGYIDLLQHKKIPGELSKEQVEALDVIYKNAIRLSNLIEDVLDIARLQARKMKFNFKKDSLSSVLNEVEKGFRKAAEDRGLHLFINIEKGIPKFEMDKTRLVQVFSNLVSNSLKFTQKGAISVNARKAGEKVVVDVSDTGMGISKKDQRKIFEKFFQAESSLTRNFGGSGLGLSIVKGILDEHGGTISVRSALKNGSVFTVKIPLNRPVDEVKRKLNIQEKLKVLEKKRKRQKTSLKKFSSEEEVAAFFK